MPFFALLNRMHNRCQDAVFRSRRRPICLSLVFKACYMYRVEVNSVMDVCPLTHGHIVTRAQKFVVIWIDWDVSVVGPYTYTKLQ